jgi:VIT1/CCC1 family predicted Fe2+/Mn2+ transporter
MKSNNGLQQLASTRPILTGFITYTISAVVFYLAFSADKFLLGKKSEFLFIASFVFLALGTLGIIKGLAKIRSEKNMPVWFVILGITFIAASFFAGTYLNKTLNA